MVLGKDDESAKLHGVKKFIGRSAGLLRKAKIRHGIATEIRDIKSRVTEVHDRRLRYGVNNGVTKPATATMVDPRLLAQYTEAKQLVRIDETRDELIKVLMDENGVSLQQGKTPDLKKLFKGLLYDLGNSINDEILDENRLISLLREFLKSKRYLIVIDDIWDILVWRVIKCAFPVNDVGNIVF